MPNGSTENTTHPMSGGGGAAPRPDPPSTPAHGMASSSPPANDRNDDEEDLDEYAWTSPSPPLSASDPLHASLRDFDSNLRCPICHEFYRIPVSLPTCHHTFCSECIRVSLKSSLKVRRVSECPVCRVKADERRVVPNRCVEGIVRRFVELRGGLRERLMMAAATTAAATTAAAAGGVTDGSMVTAGSGEVSGAGGCHASPASASAASPSSTPRGPAGGRRTSSRVSSRRAVAANAAATDDIVEDGDSDFEGSPAKPKPTPAKRGRGRPPKNHHRPSQPAVASVGTAPRPRASTHYHGLKRKQLISLLSNEGLSTSGTEKEMRDRHAEFVTLVNAECDAERPRSEEELRRELARREKARREERAASMHNGAMRDAECMDRLKRARKAAGEAPAAAAATVGGGGASATPGAARSSVAVSSGNAAFDGAMDAGFKRLIADVRRKRKRRKDGAEEEGGDVDETAAGEPGERAGGGDGADVAVTASGGAASPDPNSTTSGIPDAETTPADSGTIVPSAPSVPDRSSSHAAEVVHSPTGATAPGGGGGRGDGNGGSMAAPASSQKKPRTEVGRGPKPARSFAPSDRGRSTATTSSPPAATSVGSISGPWNCETCTYFNTVRVWPNAQCEMCEVGRRPSPDRCRRSRKPEHVVEVDC